MNVLVEMLIRASELISLLCGCAGLVLSSAILFNKASVQKASRRLNQTYNIEGLISQLNRQFYLDDVVYRFPFTCGVILTAGALFIWICLILLPIPKHFGEAVMVDIGVGFLLIMARMASMIGILTGLMLILAPGMLGRYSQSLNRWLDAEHAVTRLEQIHFDFDGWILSRPRISGLIGLALSVMLLAFTINNIIATTVR